MSTSSSILYIIVIYTIDMYKLYSSDECSSNIAHNICHLGYSDCYPAVIISNFTILHQNIIKDQMHKTIVE